MNEVRILLITPPSIFLLDERVFINLGILRVAAMLEREGYHVDHLDLCGVENFKVVVEDYLKSHVVTHIGITTTTPQLPNVAEVIKTAREHSHAKIILGGPHVTLVYSAWKREQKLGKTGRAYYALEKLTRLVDCLVAGDGEFAIFKALDPAAPQVIDADDLKSNMFLTNNVYNTLPLPARHLIDMSSYHYRIDGKSATNLIAQLGCPFNCGFCGGRLSNTFRRIRMRNTDSVMREVDFLYKEFGYTGFMFYDDELNVNRSMVELMQSLVDYQREHGVEFRLRGFVKAELFNQEQADIMYRAGFRWLLCGFESGNDRMMTNMNKKATVGDNTNAVTYARNAGLKVKALMSVGHPGESRESILDTQNWLLEVKPDDFDCTIITCYPGTPYYDEAEHHDGDIWVYTQPKTGDRLYQVQVDYTQAADYYKGDPEGGYKSYVFTDHVSREEIVECRDQLEAAVRTALKIPFNQSAVSIKYEHSMGQGFIPPSILRSTND